MGGDLFKESLSGFWGELFAVVEFWENSARREDAGGGDYGACERPSPCFIDACNAGVSLCAQIRFENRHGCYARELLGRMEHRHVLLKRIEPYQRKRNLREYFLKKYSLGEFIRRELRLQRVQGTLFLQLRTALGPSPLFQTGRGGNRVSLCALSRRGSLRCRQSGGCEVKRPGPCSSHRL